MVTYLSFLTSGDPRRVVKVRQNEIVKTKSENGSENVHRNSVLCAGGLGRVGARVAFFVVGVSKGTVAPRPRSDERPRHRRLRRADQTPGIGILDGRSPAGGSGAEDDRRATDGGHGQGDAGRALDDAGRGADEGGAQ